MNPCSFEISIDYPLYKSSKGLYFIGETPILDGKSETALGILFNPPCSDQLLYVNAITITNISDSDLSAEFYLRSNQDYGKISNLVTCTNTAICPIPIPNGLVKYVCSPQHSPNGVPIFSRIVPSNSTLVVDGGQIILGQMESLSVYIGGFIKAEFEGIRFAFGWSEQ